MAFDEGLAERVRMCVFDEPDVTEKRMFGGLAFLVSGHMTVAVGDDGLMVRVDRDDEPQLLELPGVTGTVMGRRRMRGWLDLDYSAIENDDELTAWVARSVAFVHTLPPKT
ncbi:MAG: TfoX/Sxy family protein [Mobilicoccus sp.]|nr:TfoX/Sxy family protein [Mobilicoccus sp.]